MMPPARGPVVTRKNAGGSRNEDSALERQPRRPPHLGTATARQIKPRTDNACSGTATMNRPRRPSACPNHGTSEYLQYFRPDFLGYVLPHIPACYNNGFSHRKVLRTPESLTPRLLKLIFDTPYQFIKLL